VTRKKRTIPPYLAAPMPWVLPWLSRGAAKEGLRLGQPKYPESSKAEPWELLWKDIRNLLVSRQFHAVNFDAMFTSVKVGNRSIP